MQAFKRTTVIAKVELPPSFIQALLLNTSCPSKAWPPRGCFALTSITMGRSPSSATYFNPSSGRASVSGGITVEKAHDSSTTGKPINRPDIKGPYTMPTHLRSTPRHK